MFFHFFLIVQVVPNCEEHHTFHFVFKMLFHIMGSSFRNKNSFSVCELQLLMSKKRLLDKSSDCRWFEGSCKESGESENGKYRQVVRETPWSITTFFHIAQFVLNLFNPFKIFIGKDLFVWVDSFAEGSQNFKVERDFSLT